MSILLVHGGVSGLAKNELPSLRCAFETSSGSALAALDIVERAVCALEDHPELNAGYGAVLDHDGHLELDAGIANGSMERCGGVANVSVRHPITLARRVLEETPHVLLTGAGAQAFGASMEQLERSTDEQHERWEQAHAAGRLDLADYGSPEHVDTVGAVALDDSGHLAAASSTGGVFGKMPGRVGDAPIFGAGVYASASVAVVGTGVGELFLETLACMRVARLVEEGLDPQSACEEIIEYLGTRQETAAGLLALDARGRHGAAYRGGDWPVENPAGPLRPRHLP